MSIRSRGGEPPPGAHLTTPRCGFTHHGIYVGRGKVVQYSGLSSSLRRGPIQEVTLAAFTQGRALRVQPNQPGCFSAEEVIRRARSRIGEDRYHLLRNNCEHFCEWCLRGNHYSSQVERWRHLSF